MRRKHSAQIPGMENALPLLALTILLHEPRWGISQSHHLRPPLPPATEKALLGGPALPRFLLGLADQLANRTALPECSGGSPREPLGLGECTGKPFRGSHMQVGMCHLVSLQVKFINIIVNLIFLFLLSQVTFVCQH